jgi:hypothetical protein
MEALDVVGRRVAQVRLVRVIQGETAPAGAQKRGEFFYLVDLTPRPQSMQRDSSDSRDGERRRGSGGRDRGGLAAIEEPAVREAGRWWSWRSRGRGRPWGTRPSRGKFSNDRPSGRDGDSREGRGETPRAGAGWMLSRPTDSGKRLRRRRERSSHRSRIVARRGIAPPGIAARREIAARRGIHASTTAAHGRPWARQGIVLRGPRPQGAAGGPGARPPRARAGETGRPSDLVRQMAAQGQDRARRAMADADSVHGGPMAAMVDPTLVLAEGVTTAIGSDVVVAAGTSQPCRKSRTSPPPPLRQLWRQRCQR